MPPDEELSLLIRVGQILAKQRGVQELLLNASREELESLPTPVKILLLHWVALGTDLSEAVTIEIEKEIVAMLDELL